MSLASHRTPEYQAIWAAFHRRGQPWRQYLRWIFEPPAMWHISIVAPPSDGAKRKSESANRLLQKLAGG